jgi:hypothetical protein
MTNEPQTVHDEDPMLIVLGFITAAGFGSGLPLLGLLGLLACAGHIAAKVDPEGAPARLLAVGQAQVGRLAGAAREQLPELPTLDDDQVDPPADIFELLLEGRHVLIVGSTGGGKSTLLHNLAAAHARQQANVLVIDVDAIAGKYPGYRVVGCGDDYDSAFAGLTIVRRELAQRRDARREGAREFKRLILLVDEAQDVVRELDSAWPILEDVIRRGRKVNIFAVIAAQDSQVKNLKLEGKSHLLGNLTRVDVRPQGRSRVAVVGRHAYPLARMHAPDELVRAAAPRPPQTGLRENTPDRQSEALLASLLEGGLAQSEEQSRRSEDEELDRSETTPDQSEIVAVYRRLGSKNKVWEWLRDTHGIRAKPVALRLIDEALDEQGDLVSELRPPDEAIFQ